MQKKPKKNILIPEREKVASFDVDPQLCFTPFCPNELPVPEGHLIVEELNMQAAFASKRVGSKEAHSPHAIWVANDERPMLSPLEGLNVDVCWPIHAVPGTSGFQLLEGLPPVTAYDFFVWKGVELDLHPYGSCFHDIQENLSTGVIEFLKWHRITTVIVGGLATDYCVKTTVLQLCRAGFKVYVNLAACRGISSDTAEVAIYEMEQSGAVMVESSASFYAMKTAISA